ncbi:hypothetical protein D3C81_2179280 [compost metagenome]
MTQPSGEHEGDNLHVTVRMGPKASARRNRIIIADPHRAEGCILRIVEIPEREAVTALQPAMIKTVSGFCRIYLYHVIPS